MSNKKRYCLITNDVETTSVLNHKLSDKTGELVLKEGLPLLLDLYDKYNIKSTFFFTGVFAEKFPDAVKIVATYGHEIGSHGYSHDHNQAFDILSLEEQIRHLRKSKEILENLSGEEVISFRAPAARVNKNTALALEKTGFKIDSSVASQRFDMFLSFGSYNKLNWIFSPRTPYMADRNNLWKKGDSHIFEIPISALLLPYIGTTMRMMPGINIALRKLLHFETGMNKKPIVFLTHPNEFIDEEKETYKIKRRSKNYISYVLGDIIRHKLKVKNLGSKALPLMERELLFFSKKEYSFQTCKSYYQIMLNKKI
jgi:peptidoglycan/xylan/chitin deacetylase (PgdA/CDA1 family)